MPSLNHAFVSAAADGSDATQIRPSSWNANILTTLQSTDILDEFGRLVLPSTDRLTMAGTSQLRITAYPTAFMGSYGITPTIVDGNYLLQYKEARLSGSARATIIGTGELFIFDLAPVGRLILAGRGG